MKLLLYILTIKIKIQTKLLLQIFNNLEKLILNYFEIQIYIFKNRFLRFKSNIIKIGFENFNIYF